MSHGCEERCQSAETRRSACETAERIALCYHATTGDKIWEQRIASTPHKLHQDNNYASGSPAVDESFVYYAWVEPEQFLIMALDHDGNKIWERNLGPFFSPHGYGASPMVFGDLVIYTCEHEGSEKPTTDSFIVAVNRKTGDTVWQVVRPTSRTALGGTSRSTRRSTPKSGSSATTST